MLCNLAWLCFALRLLVYCYPSLGPPLTAKVDLADGYYRVPVSASASLLLAILVPSDTSDQAIIALPLCLPMGWHHSPWYFCASTETVAALANDPTKSPLPHQLLKQTQILPEPPLPGFSPSATVLGLLIPPPFAYTDIYLNDLIIVAQPPMHLPAMNGLLHAFGSITLWIQHAV